MKIFLQEKISPRFKGVSALPKFQVGGFLRIEGDEYIISLDPPPQSDPDQPIEPKPMGPYLREPCPLGHQPIELKPR